MFNLLNKKKQPLMIGGNVLSFKSEYDAKKFLEKQGYFETKTNKSGHFKDKPTFIGSVDGKRYTWFVMEVI
ncbi:MAG: hypothetical protein RBR02_10175 [Desulfuromonadaceae bacterium]|nr:hypothetical protein [Desulfuromonadaceae bacterium]